MEVCRVSLSPRLYIGQMRPAAIPLFCCSPATPRRAKNRAASLSRHLALKGVIALAFDPFIWDAKWPLDYLISRPDVDGTRVGAGAFWQPD